MKLQKLRWNFNPLSLYRERQVRNKYGYVSRYISIHSPYTGRDDAILRQFGVDVKFQSTLPIQGETMLFSGRSELMLNFNPLSLYRERPRMEEKRKAEETFQSTLPIQGETCMGSGGKTIILHFNPLSLYRERRHLIRHHKHSYSISIHSPYTGRDFSNT